MEELRIQSVFRDCISRDVIRAIFDIHFPTCGKAEGEMYIADLTWGKGAFWGKEGAPVVGFDIAPRLGCDVKADATAAPIKDGAFEVAIFDPPHLFSRGKVFGTQLWADYGSLDTYDDVRAIYQDAAPELRRVARCGAIIKFTDMVKHGKFWPTHMIIGAKLQPILGWPEDVAILDSGIVRPQPPGRPVRHLRHAHSYFLVYKWRE